MVLVFSLHQLLTNIFDFSDASLCFSTFFEYRTYVLFMVNYQSMIEMYIFLMKNSL